MSSDVSELERRRQALAFEAAQGRDGAVQELEAVEAQLGGLKRGAERAELAERERAVRAAAEAKAAAEAERGKIARHLHDVLSARSLAAQELEFKLDEALKILDAIRALDRQAAADGHTLAVRHRGSEETIGSWLAWKFTGKVPVFGPRPPAQLRRPLCELIPPPTLSPEPDATGS